MPRLEKKTRKLNKRKKVSAEALRQKLKLKNLYIKDRLVKKYPGAMSALAERGLSLGEIRKKSAKIIGAGAIAGTLFLVPPATDKLLPQAKGIVKGVENDIVLDKRATLIAQLSELLPEGVGVLDRGTEKRVEQVLVNKTGIAVKATLEGEHLNTGYGKIGIEQHLRRYPGDTLANHGDGRVLREGMAPGLGAWGYFAHSQSQLTVELTATEKWYAVVQTLYLPEWSTRQPYLRDWYKYRKVMIVNTKNGQAVVAAIADAGPAAWTGKHYGGSPEVMDHLGGEKGLKYTKGEVLVLFVDDPDNVVPLGPVIY